MNNLKGISVVSDWGINSALRKTLFKQVRPQVFVARRLISGWGRKKKGPYRLCPLEEHRYGPWQAYKWGGAGAGAGLYILGPGVQLPSAPP